MQLVVMRHGQTPANAEGRYQGALDIGLSDTGGPRSAPRQGR